MTTRRLFLLGSATLAACTTTGMPVVPGIPTIAAMGGGTVNEDLLRRAVQIAGSGGALGLLVPYSSSDIPSATRRGLDWMRKDGIRRPQVLPLEPSAIDLVRQANFISFSGGSQKRQILALASVPGLLSELRAAHQRGCVMTGSSAGAAVMSRLMISGGRNGTAYTRAGIGFLSNIVLDQHVSERHREWRLQQVIGNNPSKLGIGIDEDTGVLLQGDTLRVYGRNKVHINEVIDGSVAVRTLRRGQTMQIPARFL